MTHLRSHDHTARCRPHQLNGISTACRCVGISRTVVREPRKELGPNWQRRRYRGRIARVAPRGRRDRASDRHFLARTVAFTRSPMTSMGTPRTSNLPDQDRRPRFRPYRLHLVRDEGGTDRDGGWLYRTEYQRRQPSAVRPAEPVWSHSAVAGRRRARCRIGHVADQKAGPIHSIGGEKLDATSRALSRQISLCTPRWRGSPRSPGMNGSRMSPRVSTTISPHTSASALSELENGST